MIVYGDPQFCQPARPLLLKLRSALERTDPHSLDQLRALLIQAGQLEQALEDADATQAPGAKSIPLAEIRKITELAASAFCDSWFHSAFEKYPINSVSGNSRPVPDHILTELATVLYGLELPFDLNVTVKSPEGFAFYTLFPEQYCASALKWAEAHRDSGPVLIVGIRSIGTALSAAVRATLQSTARAVERITVRPTGHPFDRTVQLPPAVGSFEHAIVVDEGPGLSGSSMAATARALNENGISSVTFLPGHHGSPGAASNPDVVETWRRTPCIVTRAEELRWDRLSLLESLTRETARVTGTGSDRVSADAVPKQHPAWNFIHTQAVQALLGVTNHASLPNGFDLIQDCSGGQWRQYAFYAESAWPAVAPQFERMKLRCADHNNSAVLWKFMGLGEWRDGADPHAVLRRIQRLAEQGFTPPCIGSFRGFIAQPWVEGVRLTIADGIDTSVLQRIGSYIAASAEPPMAQPELDRAVSRLSEMLYWNTHEALGSALADETRQHAQRVSFSSPPLSAGDGHLAPHEWILSPAWPNILKLDCEGHGSEHTVIGPQPIYWDVAGALIEWDLNPGSADPLFKELSRSSISIEHEALHFYMLCYAAFRMGLMSFSLAQNPDPSERSRLQHSFYFYQNKLAQSLKSEGVQNPIAH